ncbi:DUF3263 domain-containing protein [Microbacterium sp. P07]|uniref:DUF3263 domain-containing protein n=1 Tax=Microbacterium sp. P07 TaxID=3366952 RepID=UPI0037461194
MPLSDRDRALLVFEAQSVVAPGRRRSGAKEEAIRAELGMPPARYYQLLGRLIDTADALEFDPMLVRRLRRMRDEREAVRAARVTRSASS